MASRDSVGLSNVLKPINDVLVGDIPIFELRDVNGDAKIFVYADGRVVGVPANMIVINRITPVVVTLAAQARANRTRRRPGRVIKST